MTIITLHPQNSVTPRKSPILSLSLTHDTKDVRFHRRYMRKSLTQLKPHPLSMSHPWEAQTPLLKLANRSKLHFGPFQDCPSYCDHIMTGSVDVVTFYAANSKRGHGCIFEGHSRIEHIFGKDGRLRLLTEVESQLQVNNCIILDR